LLPTKERQKWPGRTAWLVRAELLGRTELHWGEMAEIARRLDCSRERVRQIADRLGVRFQPKRPKFIQCSDCGRKIAPGKLGMCADCRHRRTLVELTCIVCGKSFWRRRKDYNDFLRREPISERQGPRCSKACVSSRSPACSWCGEDVGTRWPGRIRSTHHSFCSKRKSCWREAMAIIQPVYWQRLGPELLPMREHITEIGDLLGPENLTTRGRGLASLSAAPPGAA
jgi:hypothetical protein